MMKQRFITGSRKGSQGSCSSPFMGLFLGEAWGQRGLSFRKQTWSSQHFLACSGHQWDGKSSKKPWWLILHPSLQLKYKDSIQSTPCSGTYFGTHTALCTGTFPIPKQKPQKGPFSSLQSKQDSIHTRGSLSHGWVAP